jgi:nucleoside-triphosphatase THEP1
LGPDSLALPIQGQAPRRRWLAIAALICVGVQVPGSLLLSAAALALWLGLLAAFERTSLKRLWMPRFWLVTLVFALGSGLLLGPRSGPGVRGMLSAEGLQAGLLMVLRGAFIFGLATWASRALGGKDLERAAARIGLARLGTSLSTALGLLPELQERLRARAAQRSLESRGRWWRPGRFRELAVELVCETARLADEMAARAASDRRPLVVAVVGSPGSGKTTFVGELLRLLRERGLEVGGITQPALTEEDQRVGYLLRDERTGEQRAFARRKPKTAEGGLGFSFDAEAWSWAAERIREARSTVDLVVVDELGRLEARGEGHLPALLARAEQEHARVLLLSVRADCAPAIREALGPFDLELSTTDTQSAASFADAIVDRITPSNRTNQELT